MELLILSHTFPRIITLHIYLTEREGGRFGCSGWRKMRRFSPVSSSYILILSLSPKFLVQQKPINVWCISIVLSLYSNLLAVKLPAPTGSSFTAALSQTHTHTIMTLINFKIKEMPQNYCILCLPLFVFVALHCVLFIFYSL